jgi:excisionase family DNA binding protein
MPQPQPAARTVNLRGAAAEIGVSVDHLARLIAQGELPALRVPGTGRRAGRVLILRTDLEAALKRWREAP